MHMLAFQQHVEWPPGHPEFQLTRQELSRMLPGSVQGMIVEDDAWLIDLRHRPESPVDTVHVAGNFNGWNRNAHEMTPLGDGSWGLQLRLPLGVHYYKFVHDGRDWLPDPLNTERVEDGYGGFNSILRIGAGSQKPPPGSSIGDGTIHVPSLQHLPDRSLYRKPGINGGHILRYRTAGSDVESVRCVLDSGLLLQLEPVICVDGFQFWQAELPADADIDQYVFVLQDGEVTLQDPQFYSLPEHESLEGVPAWARDAIWYQVMVDRFCNGERSNDPTPMRPWTSEWYTPSDFEGNDGQTFYEYFVFDRLYGGDLQGLTSKLDYLSELGVNALYLNPVFQSPSHHKYNATSYIHVDEHYGIPGDYESIASGEDLLDPTTWKWTESDMMFRRFLKEAKARGFRVIIDAVFNHVGVDHPAFKDVLEHGKDSRYADWFSIISWDPIEWQGWGGFKSLPVFRKSDDGIASQEVVDHIAAVTRRWMDPDGDGDPSDGIDGWRLDVPNEIARPFWVQWRSLVKSINPDAYITGEIWTRADEWLDGTSFDAVMNYQFCEVLYEYIGNRDKQISPTEADKRLWELREAYPAEISYVLQNLVDSHDTDRMVSKLFNPDRPFDGPQNREQDDPSYDGSKPDDYSYRKARLIALVQMTYVGAPMIYYGDEVGMWGSDDPNNRKPMLWPELQPYDEPGQNHIDQEHLEYYKRIIALRNDHAALRQGDFRTVLVHDDLRTWIFLRQDQSERVLVAINASGEDVSIEVPDLPGPWEQVFPDEPAGSPPSITIPSLGGAVWRQKV
ncbi:MAG: hypothetical protein CMJ32_02470 [Phycisphaerae bacterium]|nr:hypothetical protein [Phycisphaerae bacterium]